MTGLLLSAIDVMSLLTSPLAWSIALGAIGLWLMVDGTRESSRTLGKVIGFVGLIVLAIALPKLNSLSAWPEWTEQIVFWIMAGTAIICSAAAVSARNPVYTAIWFAGSLLGVAGLFLLQHAQFLGISTVVVYAGAIVVTFLFVLMLANPRGQARYDRISWSGFAVPVGILASAALVAIIINSFSSPTPRGGADVLDSNHMVRVGTELFSKHLVAVEVAGTLLLVALVGAVAIVIQSKQRGSSAAAGRDAENIEGARS